MRLSGLAQPMPMIEGYELAAGEIWSFSSYYDQLKQIWPSFLQLADDLTALRSRYLALSSLAGQQGDIEAMRAYSASATRMGDLLKEQQATVAEVNGWRETWESIKDAIRSAGQWIGLGALAGPVIIGISAVAAIAALAVIVNRYQALRAQVQREQEIIARIDAGTLTASQGAQLIQAGKEPGLLEQLTSQVVGTPWTWVLIAGVGLLLLSQGIGGRR